MLNSDKITSILSPASIAALEDIILLADIDSTNTYLLNRLKVTIPDKSLICIADTQTQGRGRHGKEWVSPAQANLYFSMSWPCKNLSAQSFSSLSVIVGIAAAQMLEKMGISDIQLKWPNDILWHGQKLGGILLESIGSPTQAGAVVIGVGLNVLMPREHAHDISQPWVDLNTILARNVERERVAAHLINQLVNTLSAVEMQGAEQLLAQWQQYDALSDQPISVKTSAGILHGIARGITAAGQLRLDDAGKIVLLSSAEILECRQVI